MTEQEEDKNTKNATDFQDLQSDIDKAKNERVKSEPGSGERRENVKTKTDVSQKKTGGGKQVSPGT